MLIGISPLRIRAVQKYQSYPAIFRGSFTRAAEISAPQLGDVFCKSLISETEVMKNNLYNKIYTQMNITSPDNIKKIAENIYANTGLDRKEILQILGKITTYASYKSLRKINQALKGNGIYKITGVDIPQDTWNEKHLICISSVLDYLSKKDVKTNPADNDKIGVIVDSVMLDFLNSLSQNDRENYIKNFLSYKKLVYIEDFEDGYNFLNRDGNLEKFAINYIKTKNKENDILNSARSLGLNITVLKNNMPDNITPNHIADNLMPSIPSKTDFSNIINAMVNKSLPENEIEQNKKYILEFLDKTLFVVSPDNFAKYLNVLKHKLDEFIKMNNKDPENVYFIVPAAKKSFISTNYQYQMINKINKPKYIYPQYNEWFEKFYDLQNIPDNSTVVIPDDCAITGLSLAKESFNYQRTVNYINRQNKNISIVIAPVVGTKSGIKNIKDICKQNKRENIDAVLYGKLIPQWHSKYSNNDERYLNMVMPSKYVTSLVLPHMGPDTNCALTHDLIKKFLFSPNAQKYNCPHLDFSFGM